jgi:hypothetical protein
LGNGDTRKRRIAVGVHPEHIMLDSFARDVMTADLTNPFLIEDPLKGDE